MSFRRFFRALLAPSSRRGRHGGDRLASEIRETIGPIGGGPGGGSGRITGSRVYRHLEDRNRG